MFPKTVYHCSCVTLEIKLCLVNGNYSLKDIIKELNKKASYTKIYCLNVEITVKMLFFLVANICI